MRKMRNIRNKVLWALIAALSLLAVGHPGAVNRALAAGAIGDIGIDADIQDNGLPPALPNPSPNNTGSTIGLIDGCMSVPVGAVFDIDVIMDVLPTGEKLAGYMFDITYDNTKIKLGNDDDGDGLYDEDTMPTDGDLDGDGWDDEEGEGDPLMISATIGHDPTPLMGIGVDFSRANGQIPGLWNEWRTLVMKFSAFPVGPKRGVLDRIRVTAVGAGLTTLDLNEVEASDELAADFTITNTGDAMIAVGQPCPMVVDNAGDGGDTSAGDGLCIATTGGCTLRAAIDESNFSATLDVIYFNIGGGGAQVIAPGLALPAMMQPVTVDGRTQPGFSGTPLITLNGGGSVPSALGLLGGNSVVMGLAITNFTGNPAVLIASSGNRVGGPATGEGNAIYSNGGSGIIVASGTANNIRRNVIYSNGFLGIDLGGDGLTADDSGDADAGANNLQNHGFFSSALSSGGYTILAGWGSFTPNTPLTVDSYYGPACDPSGFGEGQYLLGSASLTTDASGYAKISTSFAGTLPTGWFLTHTTTDAAGNTSEFGNCAQLLQDGDGDGIENTIDASGAFSNDYSDIIPLAGTTFGTVTSRGGVRLSIVPSASPFVCGPVGATPCVIIGAPGSGAGATMNRCSMGTITVPPNGLVVEKCGSVTTQVLAGPVTSQFGTIMTSLPPGTISTVTDTGGGTYDVTTSASSGASIAVGGYTMAPGQTASVTDPDGDGRVNQVDGCPTTVTPWLTPAGDVDCDAFPSSTYDPGTKRASESFLGTLPSSACAANIGPNNEDPDPWPMDNNDDRTAALGDILAYIPVFGKTGPGLPYKARYDLNQDNNIGLSDILMFIPFFNITCTP